MLRLILTPVGGYLLVAMLAAALLALLALGPASSRASPRRRRALVGVRLAIILLVVMAMLRPTLVRTTVTRKPATIVILADVSRSMQVADAIGNKTRWESLRASFEDALPAIKNFGDGVEVKLYTFDAEAHPIDVIDSPSQWPPRPDGDQTAIGWVLEDVLRREAGKRLAGVVLMTDGAQRALPAKDLSPHTPARRLADLGYRLYAVPFGQARGLDQTRDVALSDLRATQVVFVKNQLDVGAVAQFDGFVGQDVLVQLLVEAAPGKMQVVDSARLRAKQNGDRLPVDLKYVPDVAGEMKITLKVEPRTGELITTNNELSTFVTVLDGGLRVLYLNGALLPEQKWLRRSLDASPDIDVDYLYIDARKPETRPTNLAERFQPGKYDVYIIGDLDATAFTEPELEALRKAVERGAGFIMLGGIHSFGAGRYALTPLADVLPIELDRIERQNFGEAVRSDLHLPSQPRPKMRPTRIGQSHSLMQLAAGAQNQAAWDTLPALEGANRFTRAKPGATVLAETADAKSLLVAQEFGRGRVLAFAGDSTWRWYMAGHEAAHKRFWRQTVLWLARKDQSTDNTLWIKLDERRYSPGTRVEFATGARNPQGEPIADATFEAEVIRPDGSRAPARLHHEGDEMAGVFLDAVAPGDYTLVVKATRGGAALGTAQARFLVFQQDLELDNPAADRGALETLASMTEGRTVAPEQLSELFAMLKAQLQELEVQTLVKQTLWDTWPFFLLLVALLSLEWWLRKRWGLV